MTDPTLGTAEVRDRYEIRLEGRLEPRWLTRFDGMTLTTHDDGSTVLAGPVADQAALHGLLRTLCDLGLPLVSLTRTQHEDAAPDLTASATPFNQPGATQPGATAHGTSQGD